jgi:hypothetical protein
MLRNSLIYISSFLFFLAAPEAQEASAVIHIKLINGLNGQPLKLAEVGVELSPDYRELKVMTDEHGDAMLHLPNDSTIYTHNTRQYVACADEAGGLIHNDFKVSRVIESGAVQAFAKPNHCHVTTSAPVPGELVIFVRPWKFHEDNPL